MGAGFKRNEYRIIFCILRYSYGVKNKYANLKKKEISILTRIPLPKVNETLTSLEKKNIIRISQTNGYIYFHKDYDDWQLNETLTFNDKWKLQVNETLTKNLTKREVKLNETLTSTSKKPSHNENSKSSKESKEIIKKETICVVFNFWKKILNHPRAILSEDRIRDIRNRLKEGHSINDCKNAILGCKASPHHMGKNDKHKIYDAIHLIFKNGDNLERFIGYLQDAKNEEKTILPEDKNFPKRR